jgi:hypothetical protein
MWKSEAKLRAVVVRRERWRPCATVVSRVTEPHVVGVRTRTTLLEPVGRQRAVVQPHDRRHVGPVDEPVVSGRDRSRLGPAAATALGELQGGLGTLPFDPAQDRSLRRRLQMGLGAAGLSGACDRAYSPDPSSVHRAGRHRCRGRCSHERGRRDEVAACELSQHPMSVREPRSPRALLRRHTEKSKDHEIMPSGRVSGRDACHSARPGTSL